MNLVTVEKENAEGNRNYRTVAIRQSNWLRIRRRLKCKCLGVRRPQFC